MVVFNHIRFILINYLNDLYEKKLLLTIIFLFTSFFTASAQCNHTFVMIDSYGDGWNGGSVDIVVDGEVVAAGIAAADAGQSNQASYENLFPASTGSNIELANWEAGSWPSEIHGLLDGAGTEIAAGDFYDSGSSVGYCPPPPTCDHTFVMNDSWGDGWNGSTVDLSVDGEVVAAAITAADAGQSGQASTENLCLVQLKVLKSHLQIGLLVNIRVRSLGLLLMVQV